MTKKACSVPGVEERKMLEEPCKSWLPLDVPLGF